MLADETGCLASGKLVWSPLSWAQLFFPDARSMKGGGNAGDEFATSESWEELTILDSGSLRSIEERMIYSRVTLTFGWSSSVERLCILGVEW
jgi:hypothetical protein